jgi:hypothetical protein
VKLFRMPRGDLVDPGSIGHKCLKLHHYLSGKRFKPRNKIEVRIGCEDGAVVSKCDSCDCKIGQW